ncbi:hypothetical protein [Paenibacillus tyrfis]|uniref:Uncharacterized protein n=1 Tax=Paenibacillus tyrfis TaxID=1501230 RepID=A0A081P4C7_9BACL|nr:hypothetical protein [Paenibacillus tyrfis]KEQ25550.1 hypothetical protein ET33_02175 [Paenibacillus tyrfis]
MCDSKMNKLIADICVLARSISKSTDGAIRIDVDYASHVDLFTVRVYKGQDTVSAIIWEDVYLDGVNKTVISDLTKIKNKIVEFLVAGEIDFTQLFVGSKGSKDMYFLIDRHHSIQKGKSGPK